MSTSDDIAEQIQYARHHLLCTAIPFARIDWSDQTRTFRDLYHFAEQLALGAIDWYLRKRRTKKVTSVCLRYASYFFVIVGGILPLIRIFSPDIIKLVGGSVASDLSSISVEAALVLIGIAGGLHAIDRLVGASNGWRRYIASAMRINQRLLVFRFDWNELLAHEVSAWERAKPTADNQKDTKQENPDGAHSPSPAPSFAQRKYILLRTFCLDIVEVVRDETASWAAEFSDSVEQFEKQLPSGPLLRPGARQ
jgi:hypothetical protein